jgi:hypothetical protein
VFSYTTATASVIANAIPPTVAHVIAFSLFAAFSRFEINRGSRPPEPPPPRPPVRAFVRVSSTAAPLSTSFPRDDPARTRATRVDDALTRVDVIRIVVECVFVARIRRSNAGPEPPRRGRRGPCGIRAVDRVVVVVDIRVVVNVVCCVVT